MHVATMQELKQAVKQLEAEVVVTDERLAQTVRLWNVLRTIANVAVVIVLAAGIIAWANPLRIPELEAPWALMARRIALGVGILLLFAEYLMPVVRLYKIAGEDALGLKLVPRKHK